MRGWRAYYSDGRTFGSDEGAWAHLPPDGLVGVVVFNEPPYRRIIDGHDWLYMENGELYTVETHPEWSKWADPPEVLDSDCLKRGAGMDDRAWAAMQRRMFEDREWP